MQGFIKPLCLLVCTLLLASCGAINLAYNNAATFVGSEFDDAFNLDDEQAERLEQALQDFFAWHRESELPRYQQMLERSATAIGDGITATELQVIYDDLRNAAERSVRRIIDEVAPLAASLTPQQIDHYDEYHREQSKRYADYLEMSAQQRDIFREQRNLKRLQDWFGSFDELKQERVLQQLQTLPDGRIAWIRFREARHQALLSALRDAPAKGLSAAQLKFILLDPKSQHASAYEPSRAAYWQAYARFVEQLSPDLSKSELRHAAERLEYYAEIVADLRQSD